MIERRDSSLNVVPAKAGSSYLRPTLERTEHHDDAPVFTEMSDGLDTAARDVQVRDAVRPQHRERALVTFRRQVDVTVRSKGSGSHEIDVLLRHPAGGRVVDLVIRLPHRSSLALRYHSGYSEVAASPISGATRGDGF
jgi:hypothetical protein